MVVVVLVVVVLPSPWLLLASVLFRCTITDTESHPGISQTSLKLQTYQDLKRKYTKCFTDQTN